MGSDSIPWKLFGWEYKPRSSLCTHTFHSIDSKDPDIHIPDGWMPATKNKPCMLHPRRQSVTTSLVWFKKKKKKKGHVCKNLTQNGEPQKYGWESRKRRRQWVNSRGFLPSWYELPTFLRCHSVSLLKGLWFTLKDEGTGWGGGGSEGEGSVREYGMVTHLLCGVLDRNKGEEKEEEATSDTLQAEF